MEARARTFDCSPPYYHYNMGVPSIKLLSGVMMLLTFACPCLALVCNAGEEAVKTNGTSYECRTCPPGTYQPIANTTLADGFKCSKKICPPEARMTNWEDPTMGAVCVCDTSRGYYGEDPNNCRKRDEPCPTNSTLKQTGRCVCIDGHAENASGICVPVGPTSVGPTSVGPTSVGTTPGGTTPAATTGVFDKPVPQSQGYFALFALLVVPVGAVVVAVAVVVYKRVQKKKKNYYEPVNTNQSQPTSKENNGVQQSHLTQVTSCV